MVALLCGDYDDGVCDDADGRAADGVQIEPEVGPGLALDLVPGLVLDLVHDVKIDVKIGLKTDLKTDVKTDVKIEQKIVLNPRPELGSEPGLEPQLHVEDGSGPALAVEDALEPELAVEGGQIPARHQQLLSSVLSSFFSRSKTANSRWYPVDSVSAPLLLLFASDKPQALQLCKAANA